MLHCLAYPRFEGNFHYLVLSHLVIELYLAQKFMTLVLTRYQNINPEKDGATIKTTADVKTEIKIITLPDHIFRLWNDLLVSYSEGRLIDPCTGQEYRADKRFNPKTCSLKREFFRHCGHFSDTDLRDFAIHLLNKTPNRTHPYPKVSVSKTKYLIEDNQAAADWVDRRKRKKVIHEELVAIKKSPIFRDDLGDVIDKAWRRWKRSHNFSSGSWDFLLASTPITYFKKWLTNEAKCKHADEFVDKYPELLPMYQRFISLKYRLRRAFGNVDIRGFERVSMSLVTNKSWEYNGGVLRFGVMDLREAPR